MTATRECPLCGGSMHREERRAADHVPGTPEVTVRDTWEWVCPDCDYFEDAESPTPSE